MIIYSEALQKIKEVAHSSLRQKSLQHEYCTLANCVGRLVSEDLFCKEILPPFDNSAMDGFAVLSSLTEKASANHPLKLPVVNSVAAGDKPSTSTEAFSGAWEIMTGAPVPPNCDCIARIEDVVLQKDEQGRTIAIQIQHPIAARTHVRKAGSDFNKDQILLKKGMRIERQHILAFASLGYSQIPVLKTLRMARISTGKELVSHEQIPASGQIRNSTAPYFASVLPGLDIDVVSEESVGDDPKDFMKALQRAIDMNVDIVLTTGAVSMGKYDFVAPAIQEMGAQIHFHKVAIQPGKPLLFASFEKGPVFFGLPGNPVSGMVGLRFFVENYFRALRGDEFEKPISVKLAKDTKKPEGLRQFAKAILSFENGEMAVEVLSGQMSYMLSPLFKANAWAVLPENPNQMKCGEMVDVYPLFSN